MKRSITTIAALVLVVAMTLGLAACGSSKKAKEFVIGNPQPLTGVSAQVGDATSKAVNLAAKVINERGGFNGVPVRVINYDDQNSPEEAIKVANKMVQNDKVDAVLGSLLSTNLLASGSVTEDAKIVTIGCGNGPTWMAQGWKYMFRAGPNLGLGMPMLADRMVGMGVKKVAVFHGQDESTKSSAEAFKMATEERDLEIVAYESYADGDTDFSGQIAQIISANPDAVLCSANGPTMPLFAKQLRQMGYDGLAFTREAPQADAAAVAGPALDGFIFLYPYISYASPEEADDPDMQAFLKLFYEEYGEMPFHDCAYRAWDAMMVMAEAARIAGSNESTAIREAIFKIKDFKLLGGVFDYTDGSGEGLHEFRAFVIENGKTVGYNG